MGAAASQAGGAFSSIFQEDHHDDMGTGTAPDKLAEVVRHLHSNDPALQLLDLFDEQIGDAGAQALAEALPRNSTLQSLDLGANEIGDAGAQALAEALRRNSALQSLEMGLNDVGPAGAEALAAALPDHFTLQGLNLLGNEIDAAGAQALAEALPRNSTLQSLNLSRTKIGAAGARALAEALPRNSALQSLNLSGNEVGDAGAEALAAALASNSTLQFLDLSGSKVRVAGAQALAEALRHNATLRSLNLFDNQVGDTGAQALAEALPRNSTLRSLHMSFSNIGHAGAEALAAALPGNSTLQCLSLLGNEIDLAGAQALAEVLPRNSTLQSLNLSRTKTGAAGARALAEALPRNFTLQSLDLSGNEVGDAGAQALAAALASNSTLQSLDLSGNGVGDAGAGALAAVLPRNSSLQALHLLRNEVARAGAQALAAALPRNSTLRSLHLNDNRMTTEGAQAKAATLPGTSRSESAGSPWGMAGAAAAQVWAAMLPGDSKAKDTSVNQGWSTWAALGTGRGAAPPGSGPHECFRRLVRRRSQLVRSVLAAAAAGNVARLRRALDALRTFGGPDDLVGRDATGPTGRTSLMIAAEHGHVACVRLLLAEGADPWATCQTGHTACSIALERGHIRCVRLLKDVELVATLTQSVRQLGRLVSGSEDPVRERLELDDNAPAGRDSYIASGNLGDVFRMRPVAQQATAAAAAGAGGPEPSAGTDRRLAVKVILNLGDQSSRPLSRQAEADAAPFVSPGGPLHGQLHPNVGPVVWAGLSQLPPHFLWRVCASNQRVQATCPRIGDVPVGDRTMRRLYDVLRAGDLGKAFRTLSRRQALELQASTDPLPANVQAALAEQQAAGGGDGLDGLPLPKRSYCVVMPLYDTTLEAVSNRLCAGGGWPAWAVVRSWASHLVSGVAWLYNHGILHLDLKRDNVMVDGTQAEVDLGLGRLVLVDFGMHRVFPAVVDDPGGRRARMHVLPEEVWGPTDRHSRWVEVVQKGNTSQLWGNGVHVAPELHCAAKLRGELQQSTDDMAFDFEKQPVFALGVLLFEACAGGDHPIEGYDGTAKEEAVGALPPEAPYPAAFKALLRSMVSLKPRDRPPMAEVVQRLGELW